VPDANVRENHGSHADNYSIADHYTSENDLFAITQVAKNYGVRPNHDILSDLDKPGIGNP
jgi:hypothetical protein